MKYKRCLGGNELVVGVEGIELKIGVALKINTMLNAC